jgi:hypothetical protein
MFKNKRIRIVSAILLLCALYGFFFLRKQLVLKSGEAQPFKWSISDKIVGTDGYWKADCSLNTLDFRNNDEVMVRIRLKISSKEFIKHIEDCRGIVTVIIAERIHDKDGHPNLMNNNFMSTVLTPTGMPIEFFAAPDEKYHEGGKFYFYRSILELSDFKKKEQIKLLKDGIQVEYVLNKRIPSDFPEGYYRFYLDFYVNSKNSKQRLSLVSKAWLGAGKNGGISFHKQAQVIQKVYTSPVFVVGNPAIPRMIWALFTKHIFMGTKGILAEEDKSYFRLSPRYSIPDKFVIPPGRTLNIEPDFPIFFGDKSDISVDEKNWPFRVPIPLDYKSGEFSVSIILPDSSQVDLGKRRFSRQSLMGASSGTSRYRFKFSRYGQYIIKMDGWIKDLWGHTYEGGGTYHVWVAHRLTFATSVKPGSPFEAGDSYPTSVFVHPPFPAQVTIDITEYINSREDKVKNWHAEGKASRFGYFYSKEKITFQEPGEYSVRINAEYKASDGRVWIGNEVGSCVIAPADTKLIVHGKKYARIMNIPEARFNLNSEGHNKHDGKSIANTLDYVACINMFVPYYSGDVMFIAAVADGSNGIDGMLTAQFEDGLEVKTETANDIHPYNFPEKIKKHAYFYFSAIKPGIMARTLIADTRALFKDSYWSTSPTFNAFGRQINAGEDDDFPQDMYRFMGGVVVRDRENDKTDYGIYASCAIVIPKGSNGNRVVAPFSEPLLEVNGRQFYIFEAGAPSQGVMYEVHEPIGIGGMVFPATAGINCEKKIVFPDGRQVVSQGVTNKIGVLKMSPEKIIADMPGVYKIKETCWQGDYRGDVIGTADGIYNIYVDDKDTKKYFRFKNPRHFTFNPVKGLDLAGRVAADLKDVKVTYSVIMPGCVMDEGTLTVTRAGFTYKFRPEEFNAQFPNYNFSRGIEVDLATLNWKSVLKKYLGPRRNRLADLVMMTFFLEGKDKSTNKNVYDVATVMLRGQKVYIREYE